MVVVFLQWNVAGFLRVGFFSIRQMKSGDEITFDYKFQRYGYFLFSCLCSVMNIDLISFRRHDQKCFCGSANCRGIIGVPPKGTAGTGI